MALFVTFLKGFLGIIFLINLAGCTAIGQQRVLYDKGGIHIGLEPDRSLSRTSPATANSHPASFTSEQIRQLLGALQVSGYSGTLVGLVVDPPSRPVFSPEELDLIAVPIANAFQQASPHDRIVFSIPDLHARYHRERTEGELFVRIPYFFVLLKDHSAFTGTDTGGGDDERDLRDHKGMKLSVAPPLRAVTPATEKLPRWGPYEQVHLAINLQQAEAAWAAVQQAPFTSTSRGKQSEQPTQASESSLPFAPADSIDDLRLQVRELTGANQDLRKKLAEQTAEMEALKEALTRIQQDLDRAKPKAGPRRKSPPP
jgi:hypothetical protein